MYLFSFIAKCLEKVASNDILFCLQWWPPFPQLLFSLPPTTMRLPLLPEDAIVWLSHDPHLLKVSTWFSTSILKLSITRNTVGHALLLKLLDSNSPVPRQAWGGCIEGSARKSVWLECTEWWQSKMTWDWNAKRTWHHVGPFRWGQEVWEIFRGF